jgi:hypothetical protein
MHTQDARVAGNGRPTGAKVEREAKLRKLEGLRNTPDGCDYALSLIPWGLYRRFVRGKEAKAAMGFVPRYELAVMRGINIYPECVFHFADRKIAEDMYHKIAQTIIQDGLYGQPLANIMCNADPRHFSARWAGTWRPMAESEAREITGAEAAEFSDRMVQYRDRTEKRAKDIEPN